MAQISYLLFDVFAERPFQGNQLAVVPQHLDDATMQTLANELNVAETVFLHRTDDVKRPAELRIFTPRHEMPFAGHPTVGATYAIAEVLEWVPPETEAFALGERVGDVAVRLQRRDGKLFAWLRTPPVTFEQHLDRARAAASLGLNQEDLHATLPSQIAGAGNPFLFIPLKDRESVDRAWYAAGGFDQSIESHVSGVFVFCSTVQGTYARMFAPMSGIAEDPATGSATGPLYAYLTKHGALDPERTSFVSEQGVKLGRRSVLHVHMARYRIGDAPEFDVGGATIFVGEGSFRI
ncbi:MAG TPA: PhzF family phenazine biosynthesis protein [Candidatus Rubrimentiphilum sp.]|nr:PhzF family phenazine biosynthesis protein [Candidatus Rubrimentiphilum sp.]